MRCDDRSTKRKKASNQTDNRAAIRVTQEEATLSDIELDALSLSEEIVDQEIASGQEAMEEEAEPVAL